MQHIASPHNRKAIQPTCLQRAGRYGLLLFAAMALALALGACERTTAFHQFKHTPVNGWEKNDTLVFAIPSQTQAADYTPELQLRVTNNYPFTRLTLIATTTRWQTAGKPATITAIRKDTLDYLLYGDNGFPVGRGISYNQYEYPLPPVKLNPGDSLCIVVRHDMKREILPGIANIGVKLTRGGGDSGN